MEEYNLPQEEVKRFEVYKGKNTEQMPKLIADGRVPANVSQLMQRRLDLRNDKTGVKNFYRGNYFATGDGVVYHPDGRVKIVLDSQHLRDMTSESPRNGGALILSEDVYKALEGEEFKKGKLGKTGESMSKADVKAHPLWKVLARDQKLLNDYADYIFTEGKQMFGYDTEMEIFLVSANGETPEIRAWYFYGLENRSLAYGLGNIVNDFGRLLGIAPDDSNRNQRVNVYPKNKIERALEELGFSDLTKTLMNKIRRGKIKWKNTIYLKKKLIDLSCMRV